MDGNMVGQKIGLWMKSLATTEECNIIDAPDSIKERHLGMEGIANARELGGYVMADGRKIKRNHLLRTANLHEATDEDVDILGNYMKVKLIIDLRSEEEHERIPDRPVPGAQNVWVNLMGDSIGSMMGELATRPQVQQAFAQELDPQLYTIYFCKEDIFQKSMEDLYISMLVNESSKQGFRDIFHYILSLGGKPILWHCAQGKDRCGLVAVLILGALGAGYNLMLDDFEVSNYYYQGMLDRHLAWAKDYNCDEKAIAAVKSIVGVNRVAMKKALDYIRINYSSVSNYIRDELDITIGELAVIRDWYLE